MTEAPRGRQPNTHTAEHSKDAVPGRQPSVRPDCTPRLEGRQPNRLHCASPGRNTAADGYGLLRRPCHAAPQRHRLCTAGAAAEPPLCQSCHACLVASLPSRAPLRSATRAASHCKLQHRGRAGLPILTRANRERHLRLNATVLIQIGDDQLKKFRKPQKLIRTSQKCLFID